MPVNGNKKGKAAEREFCHFMAENWKLTARRSQQYKGTADSQDLEHPVDGVHFEIKRVERLHIEDAMRQASDEAAAESVPCVAHRRNHGEWMLTVKAKDLPEMARFFLKALGEPII